MSRKSRKRNRNATLERAANTYGPMGIQGGPYAGRAGNNITIPASVLAQMIQSMAPQKNQAQDFAPGSPLAPYQGIVPLGGPRQFAYPVGYNLQAGTDRTLGNRDIPSFAQLRSLAANFDGITLCERAILDMIPKLEPKVVLKKRVAETGVDENDYTPAVKRWTAFIENPSPGQGLDIHSWLRMAWTEQTQLDALALFKRKTRGGHLFGLEIIAGDSIKPLLDERGMVPQPPYPAYQQYPYGVPGDLYTTEQMVYYRESPRANTPYGFSRVERILTRVNQALRKQTKDLARFTEGNLPAGMMEVPESSLWTPDQIDSYEQAWNSLIAGNAQQQVRVKFTQPGMKYTEFADYINSDHMTEFDEFCLNVAVAVYGLSLGDLGFTEDIHKSSGDSQQNMMFRRTLAPFIAVYCHILTLLLCEAFGDADLEVVMGGFEEAEDLQTQAAAYSQLIQNAVASPASIARLLKLPDIPETGPIFVTKEGITPLANYEEGSEFRKASDDAQLAGMKLAVNPPQPQQQGAGSVQGNEDKQTPIPAKTPQKPAPGAPQGKEDDAPTKADIKRLMESVEALLRRERGGVQRADTTTTSQNAGMMVAFLLDSETAQQLVIPGGESANELHVTLAYLGDTADFTGDFEQLRHTIANFASSAHSLSGKVSGVARFTPSEHSDGLAPVYASVDVKGLHTFRETLVQHLTACDYEVANDFGSYTPHITLCYVDEDAPTPVTSVPTVPLAFDTLCLVVGDDQYFYPLGGGHVPFTPQNTERTSGISSHPARGNHQVAAGQTGVSVTQPVQERHDLQTAVDSKLVSAEYRKWFQRAKDDVKAGRAQRGFTTTILSTAIHTGISRALARCTTPEHVRMVFERADAMTDPTLLYDPKYDIWEDEDTDIRLAKLTADGVVEIEWDGIAPCDQCSPNDKVRVRVGERFPTGHRLPTVHPHCQCTVKKVASITQTTMEEVPS